MRSHCLNDLNCSHILARFTHKFLISTWNHILLNPCLLILSKITRTYFPFLALQKSEGYRADPLKVAKCFESGSALFWLEKRQNAPQIFFSKNATICVKGATIWEFFG